MSDEELAAIEDAALDLPDVKYHPEMTDIVVTSFSITDLPTGSLIVSRGSSFIILFHSNDLQCHCSILLWCAHDGSDTISLHHEPGKTRPLIFEVDTYLASMGHPVILNETGIIVRSRDFVFRPREDVMAHPRYLAAIQQLVQHLPLTHVSNDITEACRHKWQPKIWQKSEDFTKVREHYRELIRSDNPLASALRGRKPISSACVDAVILFISLLHEELYINLTDEEKAQGQVPEERRILEKNIDQYDVSRLTLPGSEMYRIYANEPEEFIKGVMTHFSKWDLIAFFLMVLITLIVFCAIYLLIRPVIFLFFGGGPKIAQFLAAIPK